MLDNIEWVSIVRHCAFKEMYDDGGYCDTKIPKFGVYYWASVADGNGENKCSECMLQALLYQLQNGGRLPEYKDEWFTDFEVLRKE